MTDERRFRFDKQDSAVTLRALGMYLDHLEILVKKEDSNDYSKGRISHWQERNTAEILAWSLGTNEHPMGGRRRSWSHDEVTGDWCRKKADELQKTKAA